MQALLDAETPVVTIVGKTSDFHVTEVLGVTLEENLAMIGDTVALSARARAARCSTTPSTSSTAGSATRSTPLQTIRAAAEAGARAW